MKSDGRKEKIFKHKAEIFFFILGCLLGGLFFVLFFAEEKDPKTNKAQGGNESYSVRTKSSYQFISPLLECEIEGEEFQSKYVPFEKKTKDRINKEIVEKNQNAAISVYSRNLNNGPWFGINEKVDFSPASLLKVVLMMAYYKLGEDQPELLAKKITAGEFENKAGLSQVVKPEEKLATGTEYTVENLIEKMIVYSDNHAMEILIDNIGEKDLFQVFIDLGIEVPGVRGSDDYMSVKDYASFFRMLYNATYLDRKHSEKALEILSRVVYDEGITRHLPNDVQVAHKFGERDYNVDGKNIQQLHDCGIVYFEKYPYLLCVMTKGDHGYDDLSAVIGEISKIIYEEVAASAL